jgi:carbamate kinase
VGIILHGYRVIITHGNGPQVGDIILKGELAKDALPRMSLDVCGVESEGKEGVIKRGYADDGARACSSTGKVSVWLFLTIVTFIVWPGRVYSSR